MLQILNSPDVGGESPRHAVVLTPSMRRPDLTVGVLRSRRCRPDDKCEDVGEPELQREDHEAEDEMKASSLGRRQYHQYGHRGETNDH